MGVSDVAVKHMCIKRIANAHHAVGDNLPLEREDGLPCVQASMMVPVQAAPCEDHKPHAEPAWAAHPRAIQLDIQYACHQNRVRLRRTNELPTVASGAGGAMRRNRTLRALAVNRGTCRGETSAVRFRSNPVDVSYHHLYRLLASRAALVW
ncbi:hypothetical protein L1887_43426 [Cichorium endivia]|nr:hypothetical protein L1887_43426 [Cichorium endivia]